MSKNLIFCGIGLNLLDVEKEYEKLDIKIDVDEVLKIIFLKLKKNFMEANI